MNVLRNLLFAALCIVSLPGIGQDTVHVDSTLSLATFPFSFDDQLTIQPKLNIYYYPFVDDVQMIEIDYYGKSLDEGRQMDMTHPRGGSWYMDALHFNIPNGYVFRDRSGKILSFFNIEKKSKIPKLESVQNAKTTTFLARNQSFENREHSFQHWYTDGGRQFKIFKDGKHGLIDAQGTVLLEPIYENIYRDGKFIRVNLNGGFTVLDQYLDTVFNKPYTRLERINKNQFIACYGKCGLLNSKGDTLHPFEFDDIQRFDQREDAYMVYIIDDMMGLLDYNFNRITPAKYPWIRISDVGYIASDSSGYSGILNRKGEELTPFIYSQVSPRMLYPSVYQVRYRDTVRNENGRRNPTYMGWVDSLGNEIGEIKYERVYDFINGVAKAQLNGHLGLVNSDGVELTEFIYDEIRNEFEGYRIVKRLGKFGVITGGGKEVLPIIYNQIACIGSEFILVRDDTGHLGFVDFENNKVTGFEYTNAWCFEGGAARVWKGEFVGLIDTSGNIIVPIEYNGIYKSREGGRLIMKDGKYGALDYDGKVAVPATYSKFKYKDGGVIEFSGPGKETFRP